MHAVNRFPFAQQDRYAELVHLWQEWSERTRPPVLPSAGQESGAWQLRSATSVGGVLPLLATGAPAAQEVAGLVRDLQQRNWAAVQPGATRVASLASQGIRQVQSASQALHDLFMAQDRYRQAQIEAQFKEFQAEREQGNFHLLSDLEKVQQSLGHSGLQAEIGSSILASSLQTQSRLIANI